MWVLGQLTIRTGTILDLCTANTFTFSRRHCAPQASVCIVSVPQRLPLPPPPLLPTAYPSSSSSPSSHTPYFSHTHSLTTHTHTHTHTHSLLPIKLILSPPSHPLPPCSHTQLHIISSSTQAQNQFPTPALPVNKLKATHLALRKAKSVTDFQNSSVSVYWAVQGGV